MALLKSLTLTLETVTPLFLAGADPRGEPELRAASFRGALRFWLRALLGAHVGYNLTALHETESAVFGSTGGASSVVVRTSAWNGSLKRGTRRALPHSHEPRKRFAPPAFAEGSQFKLTLAARPGQSDFSKEAVAALLLLLNLGGAGKRARRGFGSLKVVKVETEGLILPVEIQTLLEKQPQNGTELVTHLNEILAKTESLVGLAGHTSGGPPDDLASYPILSPKHTLVLVCKHAFPTTPHPYAQAMVDFWRKVLRASPFVDDQDTFGYAAKSIEVKEEGRIRRKQIRRASPLFVHLWRTRAGNHLVLTAFKARLSRDPDVTENWPLVEHLLKECKNKWQGEFIFGNGGW